MHSKVTSTLVPTSLTFYLNKDFATHNFVLSLIILKRCFTALFSLVVLCFRSLAIKLYFFEFKLFVNLFFNNFDFLKASFYVYEEIFVMSKNFF